MSCDQLMTIGNQAVFTKEHLGSIPPVPQSPYTTMPGFTVTVIGIRELLLKLNPSKIYGLDAIPNNILKDKIAPFLARFFQQSIDTFEWKYANILALFTKDDRSAAVNYRLTI